MAKIQISGQRLAALLRRASDGEETSALVDVARGKDGGSVKVSRAEVKKIKERLQLYRSVTLRLTNNGEIEFVSQRFVTIAPRFNYEKKKKAGGERPRRIISVSNAQDPSEVQK